MVDSRSIDCLLNIHSVINYVCNNAQNRIDYCWPTRRSDREPETTVATQNECRCHRRQWTLARCNCITLTLNQAVKIWCTRLGGKVIHLIVQNYSRSFCYRG